MTKSKEDAVSPVIGVILMVAVTVILAAVIAAFVFGMGSGVQKTKVVGVTAARGDATSINVTYQGGTDASSLQSFNLMINGAAASPPTWTPTGVGASQNIVHTATAPVKITVVGVFNDGSEQVVLDTTL